MTHKVGNVLSIEKTPDCICELCGETDELRPYGPNGESVCFTCAMKDEKAAGRAFDALMFGPGQKPH